MGRSRRAGRKVQLRRIARAYATPGVFDPRIFDSPLEPAKPSLPPPPPYPQPLIRLSLPPPLPGAGNPGPVERPPPLTRPQPPDPCPVRTWAPRPPVTPAPRAPKGALGAAPRPPSTGLEKRTPPGLKAPKAQPALMRTRPCIVRIEALPQRVRIVKRNKKPLRETKDLPSLG
ncbi:PREDICTED: proline-rich protein 12-like [Vollenhovia emeryi]|uniref:proline-rich protein 12-like n=1 Tax=Vollenhovia emeryi TaxID=411798 RepID=UPI0005F51CD0|nr:PREDICTED: proline-rich protein 12-like [Vollenhovia emeryi]